MSQPERKSDAIGAFQRAHTSYFVQQAETQCADIGAPTRMKLGGRMMAYSAKEFVAFALTAEGADVHDALVAFNLGKGPVEATPHWYIVADGYMRVERMKQQSVVEVEQLAITQAKQRLQPAKDRLGVLRDMINGPRAARKPRASKVNTLQLTPEILEQLLKLTVQPTNVYPPSELIELREKAQKDN